MSRGNDTVPVFEIGPVLIHYGLSDGLRGSGRTRVHCPFHNDRNPSASVDQDRQKFNCFTCGISEDAIGLIRWQEGYGSGKTGWDSALAKAKSISTAEHPAVPRVSSMLDWF